MEPVHTTGLYPPPPPYYFFFCFFANTESASKYLLSG